MRHINGVYTQAFKRRHQLTGHLFQGRFKAILVDRDSYRALVGLDAQPHWPGVNSVHEQVATGKSVAEAAMKYAEFVSEGNGNPVVGPTPPAAN